MASERSLLAKVVLVADAARDFDGGGLDELKLHVERLGLSAFSVHRYDEQTDELVVVQSRRSISRAVRLATDLAILEPDGAVSRSVRRALISGRLEPVIGRACWKRLDQFGCDQERFQQTARDLLSSLPESGPTGAELFRVLQPSCSRSAFLSLVSMLASCGELSTYQRRLYLAN